MCLKMRFKFAVQCTVYCVRMQRDSAVKRGHHNVGETPRGLL